MWRLENAIKTPNGVLKNFALTSRPRIDGEDISLWVKTCNILLKNAGFHPDSAFCSTSERPTSSSQVNADSAVCMRWSWGFEQVTGTAH